MRENPTQSSELRYRRRRAGAYDCFEESVKGSIEPGKLADMVVIATDFLSCPEDEIRAIDVLMTMVDGNVVYGGL